ncbi:MAG: YdbL family protein [Kiritimatiellia bacterium]|jgi:uncharacterized protein YdbL (DUF1318 family)
MKRFFTILCSVLILAAVTLPFESAVASDAESIKNAMIARRSAIAALKKSGKVGEDNKGYLAPVSGGLAGNEASTVKAENADRAKVYEAIAKKEGVSAALVGQRRAKQLAAQARPGEYIQGPDGSWKKK